ncbi:MAG: HAD family hydrolase [Candidatus Njordarchaeia archaeon]
MVKYQLVLFDLDGTLGIPSVGRKIVEMVIMDYAGYLAEKFGVEREKVFRAVVESLESLRINVPGDRKIAEVFMERIAERSGINFNLVHDETYNFYREAFPKFRAYYKQAPGAKETILDLLEKGVKVGVATDPVVLETGNIQRLEWIGLNDIDYCVITSAENSYYVKPQTQYYIQTIEKCGASPRETIMVGNTYEMDIKPIEELGGKGIYINFEGDEEIEGVTKIKNLKEILDIVE